MTDGYDLPAVGREQDAADQLAAVMLVNPSEEESAAVLWAADFFNRTAESELNFADEYSLNQQRVYDLLCWLYGSDPSRYSYIVTSGVLPDARAERCPGEYAQVLRAWNNLLGPYLKEWSRGHCAPRGEELVGRLFDFVRTRGAPPPEALASDFLSSGRIAEQVRGFPSSNQ